MWSGIDVRLCGREKRSFGISFAVGMGMGVEVDMDHGTGIVLERQS